MKCLFFWAFFLSSCTNAHAQTIRISGGLLRASQPFDVVAAQNGTNTDGYNLYIDNNLAQTGTKAQVWNNGTIKFLVANGVSRGKHAIRVGAFNVTGEVKSTTLNINIK
jgi:hypothetical protein